MENLVWIVFAGVIGLGFVVWGAVVAIGNVSRERTRREIMAYVAEGAMSPADAARLIEISEQADLRKKIMDDASWHGMDENYAATLERVLGGDKAPTGETA